MKTSNRSTFIERWIVFFPLFFLPKTFYFISLNWDTIDRSVIENWNDASSASQIRMWKTNQMETKAETKNCLLIWLTDRCVVVAVAVALGEIICSTLDYRIFGLEYKEKVSTVSIWKWCRRFLTRCFTVEVKKGAQTTQNEINTPKQLQFTFHIH